MSATTPAPASSSSTPAAPDSISSAGAAVGFGAIDLALLMMVVIWGVNAVVVKATYAQIPPMAFMAIRFVVAGSLLLIVAWSAERSLYVHRRDWLLLVAAAMVGTGLYQPLFLTGLSLTTASNTSLIIAASPAFVALLNRLLGRELLPRRGWLGIALAFVGIILIVEGSGGLEFGSDLFVGDLLILCGTFLWASYAVLAAPLMRTYSPLRVTALTTAIGALPLILIGMPAVVTLDKAAVQPSGWGGLLYSAVFAIVVAYIIWNVGVKKIGGARTSLYSNLIPVVGTVTAALFLGETITPLMVAGAGVIFVGLHLARTAKVVRKL
jgi:drug/metabolite transporter (DMT)-like permease